jgi:hypothetical protein
MLKIIMSKFHKTLVLCHIVRKIENSKIVVSNRMSLLYINATQIYAYIYIYSASVSTQFRVSPKLSQVFL